METGMMWFDNNPKMELDGKIQRAVAYYEEKYGQKPDCCMVHPSMLVGDAAALGRDDSRLEICPADFVNPNHFWIGMKEKGKKGDKPL